MKIKQFVLLTALISVLAVGLTSPAFARRGGDDTSGSDSSEVENEQETETEHASEAENEDESSDFSSDDSRAERQAKLEAKIAERRQMLEDKFDKKRDEIKEKLAGKRFELCQEREANINRLIDDGVERSKKKLAVFQRIEEAVKSFYVEKGLLAEGYDAAVANADEKEAAAIAAIEAVGQIDFDCSNVESSRPNGVIREAIHTRHDALKEYKTAVRELIQVVKKALNDSTNTESEVEQ
ncbi:TPA: hypothetical protein DIV49_01160 [Candidatus Saccharibacteria bacterium]|nr:hypothetical protein [Candidatus Saccharibacteria bacterium]HRJ90932.1 hypothetical protein [Candidatus Saccharibacteria bacterium]